MKHILLLFSDQCRADALGAYHNHEAQTPSLDALAAESQVFERAVTPSPVCVPARLCMMAGQYCNRTGNSINDGAINYDGRGLYGMLTDGGYNTCGVGKMHYPWDAYGSLGFKKRCSQEEISHPNDDYARFIENSPYKNVFDYGGQRSEMYYVPQISQLPMEAHPTQWVGDRSVEFIEQADPDQPMFLMASFIHPHPPFAPPAPWNKLFRSDKITPPFVPEQSDELRFLMNKKITNERFGISDMDALRIKNFYYACVSFVDYQVGRIIAALKAKGMYDDTLIIFAADHGELLGDYRNMGKRSMLSASSRIPFIMKVPGVEHAYRKDPVSLVDIAPTFLSWAGIPYKDGEFDGVDLLREKHDVVYSQYDTKETGVYMIAGADDSLIFHAPTQRYVYFDEFPEHIDRFDPGSERVARLKKLLDAHMQSDASKPAADPRITLKTKKYFNNARQDHSYFMKREAARIPDGYRIDLGWNKAYHQDLTWKELKEGTAEREQ